jgi:two-component system sensor histidine kinase UhpB
LGSIGRGDYGVRLAGRLPPELARLRESFNRTAGQLAGMAAENRRLNEQLLSLQEQERAELARDLHDEIGPSLFAINIDAANISRHAREGRLAPIASYVGSITEAVGHLQRQVKSMLGRLRPIGLAEFGLIEAIGNLIEFWRRRHPEIAYALELAPEAEGLGELVETTIYRVVQECLSNAIRHSRPTAISVKVDFARAGREDRDTLVVAVADDGQGMGEEPRIGYGLRGMSERVKAMGGSLRVASSPGAGLAVTASLPCSRRQPEPAGTPRAEVA